MAWWVRLLASAAARRAVFAPPLVVLALCAGCDARDASPNLLELSELNPHALEVGDRLTLSGSGFPEGRAAKVSFHGDLFRAGQAALRDVTIAATAAASDPHSLAITIGPELVREFCGTGDALHATFRGATTASFEARDPGAPPVRGTLEGVVLDVNPSSVSKSAEQAHEAEAERFARYAGMAVVHSQERDVLLIDTVDPEGRAARAGLLPGDALLELDGVRLASLSDLIPPPRTRSSRLTVRRADEKTPATFAVDVSGFQTGSPSELAPAATLLGFAVALLLVFVSPLGRALTWLEGRLTHQIRSRTEPLTRHSRLANDPHDFLGVALRELPSSPLPYFVFIVDSAWLTLLAMNRTIWARELDLPVLFLGSLTALGATALVLGGRESGRRFSLRRGLRHVLSCLVFQSPVLVAIACAVLLAGSLRTDDILLAQGGWPWQWFAFISPVACAIFGLLVLGLVPVLARAPSAVQAALGNTRSQRTSLPEWSHLILTSGVIVLVFLGGPRIPGLAAGVATGTWLSVCGALLFQVKVVLLVSSVLVLRFATNQVRLSEVASLGFRYLLPGGLGLLIATYVGEAGASGGIARQNPIVLAARVPLSYGLFFLCALSVLHVVVRVLARLGRDTPRSAVNPWL